MRPKLCDMFQCVVSISASVARILPKSIGSITRRYHLSSYFRSRERESSLQSTRRFGLTCEITYHDQYKPLPLDGQELVQRCIEDCRRVGIIAQDDSIIAANQVDMPHAYVVYDHARPRNVALIRNWLLKQDIILADAIASGILQLDHAFLAGKKAVEKRASCKRLFQRRWPRKCIGPLSANRSRALLEVKP